MRFAREIRLRRVKCLRAWVDLFHFTLRVTAPLAGEPFASRSCEGVLGYPYSFS